MCGPDPGQEATGVVHFRLRVVCTGALTRPAGQARWQRLGMGLGIWLAVGLYSRPYQAGFRIPGLTCPLRAFTGIPCPACGLTRSLMALVRGEGTLAFEEHALGPAVGLGLLGMALHSGLELAAGRGFRWMGYGRPSWWIGGLALGWGTYYVLRLMALSQTGALAEAMAQAPLGQWWAKWGG